MIQALKKAEKGRKMAKKTKTKTSRKRKNPIGGFSIGQLAIGAGLLFAGYTLFQKVKGGLNAKAPAQMSDAELNQAINAIRANPTPAAASRLLALETEAAKRIQPLSGHFPNFLA